MNLHFIRFYQYFSVLVFCVYVGLCSSVVIRQQLLEKARFEMSLCGFPLCTVHVRYFQYILW